MHRINFKNPAIFFPLILIAIELVLFLANYKPGTYLIGWDNIMPEFDLKLNMARSIHSIWQEYRGLGVLDGLAHAANLMHTIYIALLSVVLPDSMLRYAYTSLTHIVGGVAFFFLLRKLTKNDNASFIGSLFYMFNLGVVQMYFAPLEVFTTHFAALPLLALLITNALEKTNLKNLAFLFFGALFVSPQGFVPTVFIAFGVLFFFMLLVNLLHKMEFKKVFLVGLMVIAANAFWLVPYSFSAVQTGGDIRNSRINQFSSEEIFFRNKTFGDLANVTSLKGFMIDTIELDPATFNNEYFMDKWRTVAENPIYLILHLAFFGLLSIGIVEMILKRKVEFVPYSLTIFVAFIFLANSTPLFSVVNETIRNSFPLIGEAFRFPFTKFITVYAFCFAVLATFGLSFILNKYKNYQKITIAGLIIILTIISYPAFLGHFTSPYLKQELPKDYLSLFKYMQSQSPTERVVLFPVQTFWNWQYRDWGQRGSGFSWYGMPQPIMERAFDPWSPYDEQFYNEISYAANTQNSELFNDVLRKYDISYILLDESIINTLSPKEINFDSIKKFLESQESIKKEKEFGDLVLYRVNEKDGWVYELNANSTKQVFPNYSFEKEDSIYSLTDNYITDTSDPSVVNLFPSLFSEKLQENLEFNIENQKENFVLTPKSDLPNNISNYILRIPSMFETEFLIPVNVSYSDGQLQMTPVYPEIKINGAPVQLGETPITVNIQTINDPVSVEFIETKQIVNFNSQNSKAYLLNPTVNSLKFRDKDGNSETVYLDTKNLGDEAFFAKLPNEEVESITIAVEKIGSPTQSINNVIKNKKYEIKEKVSTIFSNSYSLTKVEKSADKVELSAIDGFSELTFYMPGLYHEASYILFAKTKYQSGLPMRFYLDNDIERRAEVETVFSKTIENSTVVIPKSNNYFRGYGFHFTVRSVGKEFAKSSISDIEIYPLPADFIKGIRFIDEPTYLANSNSNPKINVPSERINTSLYVAQKTEPNKYLVLSQAYDLGWKAYEVKNTNWLNTHFPMIFGKELNNHVLVNNWANGWETDKGGPTVIFFAASYFQYLGLFVTTTTALILLTSNLKKHHKEKGHHHKN
jgi:hypothetical protein